MTRLAMIALGGAIGALLRYGVTVGAQRFTGLAFPVGTLVANLVGCLLIGFGWFVFEHRIASPEARALVLVGGLGAFTTFSTFGLETVQLAKDGRMAMAALNVVANNVGGILLVLAGAGLARALIRV